MTTQTLTLTDFLLARIAEDEASTRRWSRGVLDPEASLIEKRYTHQRVLAECEAKRRIVAQYLGTIESRKSAPQPVGDLLAEFALQTLGDVLTALALPHSDHPDFREEWRP